MMITKTTPNSWNDLQNNVGNILTNCGFTVEIEKTIPSVRGQVEIDVYAEESIDGRKYSIACECKYWKTNIPQNVIHGFRTVINDLGCNIGYIISTSNFQIGAVSSAEKSNILLLTWGDFQNSFFETWYSKYFCNRIQDEIDLNFNFHMVDWFDDLSKDDRHLYNEIKNKLIEVDEVEMNFPRNILKTFGYEHPIIGKLPLLGNLFDPGQYYGEIPIDILTEAGYEEFLDKFVAYGKDTIQQFKKLEEKYATK